MYLMIILIFHAVAQDSAQVRIITVSSIQFLTICLHGMVEAGLLTSCMSAGKDLSINKLEVIMKYYVEKIGELFFTMRHIFEYYTNSNLARIMK